MQKRLMILSVFLAWVTFGEHFRLTFDFLWIFSAPSTSLDVKIFIVASYTCEMEEILAFQILKA